MTEVFGVEVGLSRARLGGPPPAPEPNARPAPCYDPGVNPLLHVKLLGGFRVERADTTQAVSDWPRRSAKTLTKLLAAHPKHAMHREQITNILWPDVDAESALNSLGKALHAARRVLEPGLPRRQDSAYLRTADSMVVLNTEHVVVDADVFERLAEDAVCRGEIAAYQAALAAYGGELLPEERYESWCAERRSALAQTHIRLLLGLAEAYDRHGARSEATDRLHELLRLDPTREVAHRQLMRLYARMGTPDQAVRQFHICQEVLRRELDLLPQPETVSLYNAICADRLPPEAPRTDQIHEHEPRVSGPVPTANSRAFVGREQAIQRMCDVLMRRDESRVAMVAVSGEAGVGKTRLLEEFAIRARKEGAVTLCGGRGAHANRFACGPFAVALEDYVAGLPESSRADLARQYPALARLVPSLGHGIPFWAPGLDPHDYYLDIIPSIARLLTNLARTKPVLLVLGDLHEVDDVSLDLIRYLAHLGIRIPLLIAGAMRDPEIESCAVLRRMIEAMTRERLWLRIDLRCLSQRTTAQLVHALLPGVHVSDKTLTLIYAASRGNPLFVHELVDGIVSSGDIAAADQGFPDFSWLAARLSVRTRSLTAMRLALMGEPLRRLLGLAAAADIAEISLSQLRAGAAALEPPLAIPELFDALDCALRMQLLEERDDGYAFRHPVVRQAMYDCLPRHRRDEFRAALTATRLRETRWIDCLRSAISPSPGVRSSLPRCRRRDEFRAVLAATGAKFTADQRPDR